MKTIPILSARSYRPAHLCNHIKPRGCLHCKSSWSHFCVCSRLWSGGCLSITPASWKTVHHTPHGTQPSQMEGPAAPTGGVNETGATCQPPQLNWTKVGNQSPLPQQLPAHEGTQACDPQWHRDRTSWGWQKVIRRVQKKQGKSSRIQESVRGALGTEKREHTLMDNRARVSLFTKLSQEQKGPEENKSHFPFPPAQNHKRI